MCALNQSVGKQAKDLRTCVRYLQDRHGTLFDEELVRSNRRKASTKSRLATTTRQGDENVDLLSAAIGFSTLPLDIVLQRVLKQPFEDGSTLFQAIENVNLWNLLPFAVASSMPREVWQKKDASEDR